jgi:hypothetical protein
MAIELQHLDSSGQSTPRTLNDPSEVDHSSLVDALNNLRVSNRSLEELQSMSSSTSNTSMSERLADIATKALPVVDGFSATVEPLWDVSLTNTPPTTEESLIRQNITDRGLCTYSDGRVYMYVPSISCWIPIQDAAAIKYIGTSAGMLSVPVNYGTSAKPYITQIINAAYVNCAPVIPTSVCIGIRRHSIVDKGASIGFQGVDLAPKIIDPHVNDVVKSLCIMPVSTRLIPTEFNKGFKCPPYKYFEKFMAIPGELDTLMWVVGNALVDPCTISKCAVLVGPGGTGKSTFMNYVSEALGNCSDVLSPSVIYGNRDLDTNTANKCCSRRLLICNDVDFEQHTLNVQNYKAILGQDLLDAEPVKSKATCSMLMGCNKLPDPTTTVQWHSTAISRRTVVVPFYTDVDMYIANNAIPNSEHDHLMFVIKAVEIRLAYKDMPVTAKSVLLTLCGRSFVHLKDILVVDENATVAQCAAAQAKISTMIGIDTSDIGRMADKISHACVHRVKHNRYIRSIKLKNA